MEYIKSQNSKKYTLEIQKRILKNAGKQLVNILPANKVRVIKLGMRKQDDAMLKRYAGSFEFNSK